MAKSKKKLLFIALAIVVGGGIITAGIVKTVNKEEKGGTYVSVTEVEELKDFDSTLISDGILKTKDQRTIVSSLPYNIEEVFFKEGDKVKKGDILVKLDTKDLDYKIKTAEINLELERERLRTMVQKFETGSNTLQLEKSVSDSRLAYDNAKKKHESSKKLYEAGAISKAQLELEEMAVITAKSSFEFAESQLLDAKTDNDIKSNIELQKKNVQIQELNLAAQKESLEKAIITSPIDGTIVLLNGKAGISAATATPLAIIDDTRNLEIEVNISEYDISSIKVEQKVQVTGEAFKDKEFEGTVSYIAPTATVINTGSGTEINVRIKVDILNWDDSLKPGLSANVAIKTDYKKNALVVPYEALYQKKDGGTVIFKVENNKAVEIPITVGIQGDLKVEVISETIKNGDKIILNPTEKTVDGMDVSILDKGDKK